MSVSGARLQFSITNDVRCIKTTSHYHNLLPTWVFFFRSDSSRLIIPSISFFDLFFFAAFIEVDDLDEVKVVLIFDFPDTNGKGNVLVAQLQGNTAGVGRFDSAVPHVIVL